MALLSERLRLWRSKLASLHITFILARHFHKENLMPWSSEGGNGGSWKPSGPGPWGPKPGGTPPEFEEFLKRGQEKIKQFMPGSGGVGGRVSGAIL
jgi:hypothetical protein